MEANKYTCENCGKQYVNRSGLWKHLRVCKAKTSEEPSNESKEETKPETESKNEEEKEETIETNNGTEIKRWSPTEILERYESKKSTNAPFISIHYGMKRSGKTTVIKKIAKTIQPVFDKIYLFTTTFDNAEEFKQLLNLDQKKIYGGFDEEKTTTFLNELLKYQTDTKAVKKILLIMDDILDGENAIHQSKLLTSLFANHRHYNISVILSTQHSKAISPATRRNCDYAFCHFTKDHDVKDDLRKLYLSNLSRPEFDEIMQDVTANYNVMVLLTLEHETNLNVYNANWN